MRCWAVVRQIAHPYIGPMANPSDSWFFRFGMVRKSLSHKHLRQTRQNKRFFSRLARTSAAVGPLSMRPAGTEVTSQQWRRAPRNGCSQNEMRSLK